MSGDTGVSASLIMGNNYFSANTNFLVADVAKTYAIHILKLTILLVNNLTLY